MNLFNLFSALFLCATALASDHSSSRWWSQPTARPTVDASKCSDYYSLLEQCRTVQYDSGPKAQTKTVASDMPKDCSSLAHAWGEIIKICDFKGGLPTSVGNQPPTVTPAHSVGNGPAISAARTTPEVSKRDPKKKKPKPTCNIEGDSPFDTCGSDMRDYPDSIEGDSIFSGPSPTGQEQNRDPKKKKPKPTCNIENDSPFESCGSDKRDNEDSVEQSSDLAMVKRASRCPQNFHFLTAEHETYHYWFCCPAELDKMLLRESYAAAPKCCKKSDKRCNIDAVDVLDGCDPSDEVTDYGGVKGCRIRATKNDKREAIAGSTGLTAGHDPVTSLGPDSDLQPTTYPVAPPDHGQYCHFGGCGKGQVTSYVDGLFCQCVSAPPPTPITVTAHKPVTGFISDVVGRDVEATQTISLPDLEPYLPHSKTGTITITITVPVQTTMQTSTKQDSIKALDVMTKPATLTISPGVTFQVASGICGFCDYAKDNNFHAGNGLPFGVEPTAARSYCSASATACPQ